MTHRVLAISLVCLACAASAPAAIASFEAAEAEEMAVSAGEPVVEAVNGSVVIRNNNSGDNTFTVYCVTGQQVKSVRLSGDASTSIQLPKGFYVVKCNEAWSRKIVVR